MPKKLTFERLAAMTQHGLKDVEQRLGEKIDGVMDISKAILKVVENIEGRIGEVHTVVRVDMPEVREKLETFEKRIDRIEKKVGV